MGGVAQPHRHAPPAGRRLQHELGEPGHLSVSIAAVTTANGTFVIENWAQDEPYEDGEAGKLTRAHVAKKFSGDLEATSATEIMMINTREEGSDAYVALGLLTATPPGNSGSLG